MSADNASMPSNDDDISLLDLLLVVAENLRLLLLGPLLAGALALGVASLLPRSYESVTLIRGGSAALPGLVMSRPVLAAVLEGTKEAGTSVPQERALRDLGERIKASFNNKDQLVTIEVRGTTPQEAQRTGQQLFQQLKAISAPSGPERARLNQQLADIQRRTAQVDRSIAMLTSQLQGKVVDLRPEAAQGYAQLIQAARQLDSDRLALEKQLAGIDESNLLLAPSLPDLPVSTKRRLIVPLAMLGTGFGLLLFVFFRQSLRNARQDPVSATKVERATSALKTALFLRRA